MRGCGHDPVTAAQDLVLVHMHRKAPNVIRQIFVQQFPNVSWRRLATARRIPLEVDGGAT